MEVFRLTTTKYSKTLTASGKEARWNYDNEFVLYCGASRSLSTLELCVRKNTIQTALQYEIMVLSISDNEEMITKVQKKDLPKNWRETTTTPVELRKIGSEWYTNKKSLVLQVPSIIVPQEYNYLININHQDFKDENVKLVRNEEYFWDDRLIVP
jgi:RES domain-containing protein